MRFKQGWDQRMRPRSCFPQWIAPSTPGEAVTSSRFWLTMRESAFRESNRGDGRGFRQIFGVNTKGTWLVTKATIPRLSVGGRIVNISSGASRRPGSLFGLCAMTKAAVEAMTFGAGSRAWPARNYSEYDCTGLDRNRRKRFGAVECRRRTQRYQPNSSWLIGFAGGHRRSRCISGFRR